MFCFFLFFDIHLTIVLDVGLVGCNWIGKETFNFYSSIKQAWQPRSCSFLSNSGITMKLEEQLEEKYKHQSNVQSLFDALYLSFLSSIPNIVGSNPLWNSFSISKYHKVASITTSQLKARLGFTNCLWRGNLMVIYCRHPYGRVHMGTCPHQACTVIYFLKN